MGRTKFRIFDLVCCGVKGPGCISVDQDMVGMSIAASLVKSDQNIGAKFSNDGNEFAYYCSRARSLQAMRILVIRGSRSARIAVIQKSQIANVQDIESR